MLYIWSDLDFIFWLFNQSFRHSLLFEERNAKHFLEDQAKKRRII